MALSLCLVGGMGWLHFVFGWKDEHHLMFCSVSSHFVGPTCHTPASSSPTCSPPCSLSAPACRRHKLHNPPRRCPPSARALRARHAAPPPAASAARCCCRGLCTLPCDAGAPPPRRDPLGPAFRLRVVLHAGPSSASAPCSASARAPPRLEHGLRVMLHADWSSASASELGRRRSSTSTRAPPLSRARLLPECRAPPAPALRGAAAQRGRGRRRSAACPPPRRAPPAAASRAVAGRGADRVAGGAAAGVPPAHLRAQLRPLRASGGLAVGSPCSG